MTFSFSACYPIITFDIFKLQGPAGIAGRPGEPGMKGFSGPTGLRGEPGNKGESGEPVRIPAVLRWIKRECSSVHSMVADIDFLHEE